jgi:chromosome segregation ATPase
VSGAAAAAEGLGDVDVDVEEDIDVDGASEKEAVLEAVHEEEQVVAEMAAQVSREQAALKRRMDKRDVEITEARRAAGAGTEEEQARLSKELKGLLKEKARLKGLLDGKCSEAEGIRRELDELRRRKRQLEADIAQERKASRAYRQEKDKQVSALAREIQQRDMQINKLKVAGERKESTLRRQLESAQAKAERLEREKCVRSTPRNVTRATAKMQQRQAEKWAIASKMVEKEVMCAKIQRAIDDLTQARTEATEAIREIEDGELPMCADMADSSAVAALHDTLEGHRERLQHIATRLGEQGELLSDLQDGATIDAVLGSCTLNELKVVARHLFHDLVARTVAANANATANVLSRHSSRTALHPQPDQTPLRMLPAPQP